MKSFIPWVLGGLLVLGILAQGIAQTLSVDLNQASFTWTASVADATHGTPTSYTMKCGTAAGGPYSTTKSVVGTPLPTSIAANQVLTTPGTYFCVVTASNQFGESLASNEVTFAIGYGPSGPTGLSIIAQ